MLLAICTVPQKCPESGKKQKFCFLYVQINYRELYSERTGRPAWRREYLLHFFFSKSKSPNTFMLVNGYMHVCQRISKNLSAKIARKSHFLPKMAMFWTALYALGRKICVFVVMCTIHCIVVSDTFHIVWAVNLSKIKKTNDA